MELYNAYLFMGPIKKVKPGRSGPGNSVVPAPSLSIESTLPFFFLHSFILFSPFPFGNFSFWNSNAIALRVQSLSGVR